jgi:hypothetical protein
MLILIRFFHILTIDGGYCAVQKTRHMLMFSAPRSAKNYPDRLNLLSCWESGKAQPIKIKIVARELAL